MDRDTVLEKHRKAQGKIETMPKVVLENREDLSTYYTPGVAYVSQAIAADESKVYDYTAKSNTIAIVTDGTRILGLGKIGPKAGLPVMEGKATLFKKFGGVDAVPICLNTTDEDEIVSIVKSISPGFGGINIEDIESPKSFSIAQRLQEYLDIPVFHDDRQGTGVVVLAALINSLKLAGKKKDARIIMNGAGSAGFGITMQLVHSGYKNIIVVDRTGAIYEGRQNDMNDFKAEIAKQTNMERKSGMLEDVVKGADVLIGASTKGAFTKAHIASMAEKPIVFAIANPDPEISYQDAKDAGAFIAATGRSDSPNQVNNILAFPGVMRGLLDTRAKKVTYSALESAALAIAKVSQKGLDADHIISSTMDDRFAIGVVPRISAAVAEAVTKEGLARQNLSYEEAKERAKLVIKRYNKIEKRVVKFLPE